MTNEMQIGITNSLLVVEVTFESAGQFVVNPVSPDRGRRAEEFPPLEVIVISVQNWSRKRG